MVSKAFQDRVGKEINSTAKARRLGSMGGKQLGINNKLRKTFAELGKAMLDSEAIPEEIESIREQFPGLDKEEITNRVLMLRAQMLKAIMTGDSKAFEVMRDTIGEKPVEKVETNNVSKTKTTLVITEEEMVKRKKKMKKELTDD